jgi:hypothetical protein
MVADTHHQRVAADDTINFDALYLHPDRHQTDRQQNDRQQNDRQQNDRHRPDGQLPGQLSIDDIPGGTIDPAGPGEATG